MMRKNTNLEDRRVRRTRKLIRKSFLALLEDKDYEQITVTDIIEKADYNRATFYRHYRDKEELVTEIIERQIEILIEAILQPLKNKEMMEIRELKPKDIKIFEHILEEIEFYRLWDKLKTIPNFLINYIDALKYLHFSYIKFVVPHEDIDKNLYTKFYVYGIVGILFSWMENDFREPPSFMAEQLWSVLTSPPNHIYICINKEEQNDI